MPNNYFQVWKLVRNKPNGSNPDGCTLMCEDGNGNKLKSQRIQFTDFPFDQFTDTPTLWFSTADKVLYLPSEH